MVLLQGYEYHGWLDSQVQHTKLYEAGLHVQLRNEGFSAF